MAYPTTIYLALTSHYDSRSEVICASVNLEQVLLEAKKNPAWSGGSIEFQKWDVMSGTRLAME